MKQMNREYARQLWISRLNDLGDSGLTQKEWCATKDIPESTLRYWISKLKQSAAKEETATDWLMVDMAEKNHGIAKIHLPEPTKPEISAINIRLGDFTVELQNGCDSQRLTEVLRILKSL